MRSMYAGVSGLQNHQTKMDVIGNNIANVNTNGFKKSRVLFQDTLYQTMRGGSSPTDARGGTNPMGVGLGMQVASIDQIHTPAPAQSTGKTTDMAVDGNGYFIVEDGNERYYTRAGGFDFDRNGNLVTTADGFKVQGWNADENWNIDTVAPPEDIDIQDLRSVEPRATTEMTFTGNLDSTLRAINEGEDENFVFQPDQEGSVIFNNENSVVTSKEMYNSLGDEEIVYFRFYKFDGGDDGITWGCQVSLDPDFGDIDDVDELNPSNESDTITELPFDQDTGKLPVGTSATLKIQDDNEIDFGNDDDVREIEIDFSDLTQYNSSSTAWAEHQDGYTSGDLTSFDVGADGSVLGVYDNGEIRNLARVALANFQNPTGLQQEGNNLYQVTNNSGDANIGAPADQGMGSIMPGSLEMSNVDLSEEFTDMIVTQRGFQANSRLITTSDEMLQELTNLKR